MHAHSGDFHPVGIPGNDNADFSKLVSDGLSGHGP